MLTRFILLLAVMLSIGCNTALNAREITSDLTRGVNLTGWFQFGDFQESRFTELQVLRDAGANFIRLPVQPTLFYDSTSSSWQLLKRTLLEAQRVGIRVIVDFHPSLNSQRDMLSGDPKFLDLIGNMGTFLKDYPSALLELQNEPISPVGDTCNPAFDWNTVQQGFYQKARAANKNITIVLTGACWGGIDGLLKVNPVNDQNVIYSLHFYDPMYFTHQGASWTGGDLPFLKNIPYPPTPENVAAIIPSVTYAMPSNAKKSAIRQALLEYGQSGYNKAKILARLEVAKNWATKNNARLLLGEFGVLQTEAPAQDRIQFMKDVRESAESLGMAVAAWDYGPTSGFGFHRDLKTEAGMFEAMGFKAPTNSVATPANTAPTSSYPVNPVLGGKTMIADFTAGSQNVFGVPTTYWAYGQPAQPTFTPAVGGAAPITNGRLEFDYSIPLANDYGGITAVIPVTAQGAIDARTFTHLSLEASVVGGGQVRVGLASSKIDDGGDHPVYTFEASETPTVYNLPLEVFKQANWGKAVKPVDVIQQLERLEITATTQGKAGRMRIDNLAFANLIDASSLPEVPSNLQRLLFDFSNPGNTGNQGDTWSVNAYQQNASSLSIATSSLVNNALEMQFKLPTPNDWAGAIVSFNFAQNTNLQNVNAIRIDLSATGVQTVRLEFPNTLDTGNDNPQFILNVSPNQKTYRVPISEFAQAGWGKPVDLLEALKNVRGVGVFVDTVGSAGTLRVDNVILEQKP
jgi:endoglucanase